MQKNIIILLKRIFFFLISTNIYIALAAVFLTISTQIHLGINPSFHPFLFLIFFATIFDYNLHRLITILTNKEALRNDKHSWVLKYPKFFFAIIVSSILGFFISLLLAKIEVIISLVPLALITVLYSLPRFKTAPNFIRLLKLREVPFVKIFLIALVWASATILLPVSQSSLTFDRLQVTALMIERFLFIFAITIPFDIRDIEQDKKSNIKTFPLYFGVEKSLLIANIGLMISFVISIIHTIYTGQYFLLSALSVSTISTLFFLNNNKIKAMKFYHYGILDGTMLLQGFLIFVAYHLFQFIVK